MQHKESLAHAKPFLKWAGGKSQLLHTFQGYYPKELREGSIKRYIEPFVGSGAVLFDIVQNFKVDDAIIIDINPELILTYEVIKQDVESLIRHLTNYENDYYHCRNLEEKKSLYYRVREEYNSEKSMFDYEHFSEKSVSRAAQGIFLNRTCFNGLFRVNKKGLFNVPIGDYNKPRICDEINLRAVSRVLQNVTIICGTYSESGSFITDHSFVYFDPPYLPLNVTSSFTSYSKEDFNENDQKNLSAFFRELSREKVYLMLSNSDPDSGGGERNPFETWYKGFDINRVEARRTINSRADKRGQIKELVITNYIPPVIQEQNYCGKGDIEAEEISLS